MFNDVTARSALCAVSLAASLLLAPAAMAQTTAAPADGTGATAQVPAPVATDQGGAAAATAPGGQTDPHALLDEMSGGPQGSPTAQRGNPLSGTSTSIPTANPATVRPLEQRTGGNENVTVEDTGIEGECDPVVSLGCPPISDRLPQDDAAARGTAGAAAQPATAGATEPAAAQ